MLLHEDLHGQGRGCAAAAALHHSPEHALHQPELPALHVHLQHIHLAVAKLLHEAEEAAVLAAGLLAVPHAQGVEVYAGGQRWHPGSLHCAVKGEDLAGRGCQHGLLKLKVPIAAQGVDDAAWLQGASRAHVLAAIPRAVALAASQGLHSWQGLVGLVGGLLVGAQVLAPRQLVRELHNGGAVGHHGLSCCSKGASIPGRQGAVGAAVSAGVKEARHREAQARAASGGWRWLRRSGRRLGWLLGWWWQLRTDWRGRRCSHLGWQGNKG